MGKPKQNKDIRKRDLMSSARIRAADNDESGKKFVLSFSSEEPYLRWDGLEILDHSDGCIDLSRLLEIGVLLFNHERDSVIGKVTRVWVENQRGCAEVEFDDDEQAEVIRKKVQSGTLKGVSVGYTVNKWEIVTVGQKSEDGRFTGPCNVAKNWMPYEISIVSVPADSSVGVGRDFDDDVNDPIGSDDTETRSLSYYESVIQNNLNRGGFTR